MTGSNPAAIAIADDGSVYIADRGGDMITKLLADGSAPGAPWPVAVGFQPSSIVVDAAIADSIEQAGDPAPLGAGDPPSSSARPPARCL